MRKLICALACRNNGSRLYGKPLQNLDIGRSYTILDYMIDEIQTFPEVEEIVLGISEGNHNLPFVEFAEKRGLRYIIGDQQDVLQRLISCAELANGTDIFRVTSESPFIYSEPLADAWKQHIEGDFDLTSAELVPDGTGFEIIKLAAYLISHKHGDQRHRSELCSLYIRENKASFRLNPIKIPSSLQRTDLRLTVDYPEDLIVFRAVYQALATLAPNIPLVKIIDFLDDSPDLRKLIEPFVETGNTTMYV